MRERKFFYLFTCEYCFSHYVTAFILLITHFKLYLPDWRGYLLSGFALVWVANMYINLFARIKMAVKVERLKATVEEERRIQMEKENHRHNKAEE